MDTKVGKDFLSNIFAASSDALSEREFMKGWAAFLYTVSAAWTIRQLAARRNAKRSIADSADRGLDSPATPKRGKGNLLEDSPASTVSTQAESVIVFMEKNYKIGFDIRVMGLSFHSLPPAMPLVKSVYDGSWAFEAGIMIGDQLVRLEGTDVEQMQNWEFMKLMQKRPLSMTLRRQTHKDAADLSTEASLSEGEDNSSDILKAQEAASKEAAAAQEIAAAAEAELEAIKAAMGYQELEVDANEITLGLSFFDLPPTDSVVVSKVHPGTWAEAKGIQTGEELVLMNGRSVKTMSREEFCSTIRLRPLPLQIRRHK
jgi:C-terminal processing protease CtpA/Prc